jgi:NTP pyrophosphatase (non-canonical NTP hydrolase)
MPRKYVRSTKTREEGPKLATAVDMCTLQAAAELTSSTGTFQGCEAAADRLISKKEESSQDCLYAVNGSLRAIIGWGKYLDVFKKEVFYGKVRPNERYLPVKHSFMKDMQRSERVLFMRLLHGMVGAVTEVAELLEPMAKILDSSDSEVCADAVAGLDLVNIQEECGDLLWYICEILNAIHGAEGDDTSEGHKGPAVRIELQAVADTLLRKLEKRYPDGYDDGRALMRDLEGERQVLEKGVGRSLFADQEEDG